MSFSLSCETTAEQTNKQNTTSKSSPDSVYAKSELRSSKVCQELIFYHSIWITWFLLCISPFNNTQLYFLQSTPKTLIEEIIKQTDSWI